MEAIEVCDAVGTAGGIYTRCHPCLGHNYRHTVRASAAIASLDTEGVTDVMVFRQRDHHVVSLNMSLGARDEGIKLIHSSKCSRRMGKISLFGQRRVAAGALSFHALEWAHKHHDTFVFITSLHCLLRKCEKNWKA